MNSKPLISNEISAASGSLNDSPTANSMDRLFPFPTPLVYEHKPNDKGCIDLVAYDCVIPCLFPCLENCCKATKLDYDQGINAKMWGKGGYAGGKVLMPDGTTEIMELKRVVGCCCCGGGNPIPMPPGVGCLGE